MPTYTNGTTDRIVWKGISWEPGASRALAFFVPDVSLGLTVSSAEPYVAGPVLCAGDTVLTASDTEDVDIPYCERYRLSAIAVSGTATLMIGDGDESITLDADTEYEGWIEWDKAAAIHLASAAGATVRVVAEVA